MPDIDKIAVAILQLEVIMSGRGVPANLLALDDITAPGTSANGEPVEPVTLPLAPDSREGEGGLGVVHITSQCQAVLDNAATPS